MQKWKNRKERNEPEKRVIRTARTQSEMNFAAANGYKLLFRQAASGEGVRHQLAIYQNTETGQVIFTDDRRMPPDWADGSEKIHQQVFPYFLYKPQGPAMPVAAYVIPHDLAPGTEVFVEDAIEDLICEMPQDTAERMSGWWAIWNGEDLSFLPHESGGILG